LVNKDILILGANSPEMQLLRSRLARMGYRVIPAKTPDQAHGFLRVAGGRVGAVVVPSDLPAVSLRSALESMRRLTPEHEITFLGAGHDPGPAERSRMREAGVHLPIFDPVDPHTLRFQINRALACGRPFRGQRRTLRAPADWPVMVRSVGREKEGRLYSISASGGFVALSQPWMVKSQVMVRATIPDTGVVSATGRVVMTNVPGNVMRRGLPFGMGIQFEHLSEAVSVTFLVYAQERFRALSM
jgi:hypothetical protein